MGVVSGANSVGVKPVVETNSRGQSSRLSDDGLKRSMSASPRIGDKYQTKRMRVTDQDSWSSSYSSEANDERAKRIGVDYRSDDEDKESSGFKTPPGELVLKEKSEDESDEAMGARQRRRGQRGPPALYWGDLNPSLSGIAWDVSKEAKRRMREGRESRREEGDDQWKRWEGDWQTHTVAILRGKERGRGRGGRKGVRRTVETALPSRYEKV